MVGDIRKWSPGYKVTVTAPSPAAEQWGKTPVAECSHSVWRGEGSCMYCGLSALAVIASNSLLKEALESVWLHQGCTPPVGCGECDRRIAEALA